MVHSGDQLRLLDRHELVIGQPLGGDVRSRTGQVLICAGTVLAQEHIDQLGPRAIVAMYGGPEWGATDTAQQSSPDEVVDLLYGRDGLRGSTSNERAHPRRAWAVPLTVLIAEKSGIGLAYRELQVTAVDLSRGGFAFAHRHYIAAGTSVRAQFDQLPNQPRIEGVVRHCRLIRGQKHQVGVQFIRPKKLPQT